MEIIGISLSYRTCSVDKRESLYLTNSEIQELITILKKELLLEGIIISTCNRTEILGLTKNDSIQPIDLINEILKFKPIENLTTDDFLKFFNCTAVKHILEVVSGIDSLIIGDSQILGQVKDAFILSENSKFLGTIFHRIEQISLKLGKKVISETILGEGAVSVSYAAIKVIEKIFSHFQNKKALIIGAGETAELAALHLKELNLEKIYITNRTREKGENLADKISAEFIEFENFDSIIQEIDILISATSSPNYLINFDQINSFRKFRRGKPLVIMDIAIPRDIDPKVANLDWIFYHDVDSLQKIIDQNIEKRKAEIPKIKSFIQEEMVTFFSWYNTLQIIPTLKNFRDFFEEIRSDEFEKIKNKLLPEEIEKVENMTKRLIGRILHNPTINLKKLSEDGSNYEKSSKYSKMLIELFNLNKSSKYE